MRPRDSDEFRNKPITLKVDVEERKDKPGQYSNRIKGYAPLGAQPTQAPASVAAAAVQTLTAAPAATPPWRR